MKPLLFILFLSFTSLFAHAQDTLNLLDKQLIRDSLVSLALREYPFMKVKEANIDYARRNLGYTKTTWTQGMRVFYNLNDQVYNPDLVYNRPIFGAGLSLSLGDFVSLPSRSKMAKAEIVAAEGEKEMQERLIRKDVLSRYNNYLTTLQLFILKTQELEEARLLHNTVTEKFNTGQLSLEDHTRATLFLSQAKEQHFMRANDLRNAKLAVEEYIGQDLDTFLKSFN